ncbi:MAG: 16S rRNA (uracil(1498)-N(3))-methyltransferase [Tannerellaceae bacterium]|jgi:16S rRNA (uracil1498-N3)-methyltransferase|nr:16S rRNA (uracil(1498)-N(3))-methyltransferase [Tannerellaceae bacterium]
MQIFYAPDISIRPELPEEEARHALRTLRLGEGSEIMIADGRGAFYKAVILNPNPKHCQVSIAERIEQPPLWNFHLHIAIAPTKNIDRTEWFCEKATEIGIDAITFLDCRFSERHEVKIPRLEKILVSAMKQSVKATAPKLTGMTDFGAFIRQPFQGNAFIAHCAEGVKPLLQHACHPRIATLILIGPEGDFSPGEISEAVDCGFRAVSLGNSRLRTETAALAACHTLHIVNYDFPAKGLPLVAELR